MTGAPVVNRARLALAAVACLASVVALSPGHVAAATPCGPVPAVMPAAVVPVHWECVPDDDRPGYGWAVVVNIPS